jgi:hypothetical protein
VKPWECAVRVVTLSDERIQQVKISYVTRRVDMVTRFGLVDRSPSAGDLVLATVTGIGQHKALELTGSRRSTLHIGDEVLVSYGNRYAPDQFEAAIPDDLGDCHLAAAGGVAARVLSQHADIAAPTQLAPVGLLVGPCGRVLNLRDLALVPATPSLYRPPTLAVMGTSMNAGKTTSAAAVIRGLTRAGLRVGAAKITGTGAGGDPWQMSDAGAVRVLDFTDAGHPSTCGLGVDELLDVVRLLRGHLLAAGAEVIVLEVADGLLQRETRTLLHTSEFVDGVDGVLFAAAEAMGAMAGMRALNDAGVPVVAIGGVLTSSPLATREAAAHTGLPVWSRAELAEPRTARGLLAHFRVRATA